VESVILEPALPDLLHTQFKEAATGAAKDIQDFKHLMGHPRNKEVLEKAKESRARDPEKITPWLVTEHEDWLDVKKEDNSDDFDMAGNDEETKTPDIDTKTEDIKETLDKFEKSHRGITTFIKPEFKSMMVRLPLGSLGAGDSRWGGAFSCAHYLRETSSGMISALDVGRHWDKTLTFLGRPTFTSQDHVRD
jgi:hypothetical protein